MVGSRNFQVLEWMKMLMIHANVRKGQNKVQQQIFLDLAIEIVIKLFEKDKWIEYEGV